MQVPMRQDLGRSQKGLLAVERPGWKGMRLWRHASERGHGKGPKPTLRPKGEATKVAGQYRDARFELPGCEGEHPAAPGPGA